MTDTVTRLMELADEYADSAEAKGKGHPKYAEARQALEAELTRLFTPLTEVQIATVYFGATEQSLRPQDNVLAHKFARLVEFQHGIGGES